MPIKKDLALAWGALSAGGMVSLTALAVLSSAHLYFGLGAGACFASGLGAFCLARTFKAPEALKPLYEDEQPSPASAEESNQTRETLETPEESPEEKVAEFSSDPLPVVVKKGVLGRQKRQEQSQLVSFADDAINENIESAEANMRIVDLEGEDKIPTGDLWSCMNSN